MENTKPFELKYCTKCLQNNLRPHIHFHEDGVCAPCKNYEKQKTTDWDARWKELEKLADKYRGCNGNGYDCAIAASSGKDSHTIISLVKDKLKLNPVILSVGNVGWTNIGRKNLDNISDSFGVDVLIHKPNIDLTRKLARVTFETQMKGSSYWDILAYAYPFRMAKKLNCNLLFWGESVSFSYGGVDAEETPSGKMMSENKVATPEFEKWIADGIATPQELESARMMTPEECEASGLEPVYMQYFFPWDSYDNYIIAQRNGFLNLNHEHKREGTIEQFNQIDTLPYLVTQYGKYLKFGFASATEMACRYIRAGRITREEAIKLVKEKDKILDQDVAKGFMDFVGLKPKEFWAIMDKWYNPNLFYQDRKGIWHEKFEVGVGMKPEWKKQ